jgi:hypothetical protein
MRSAEPVGRLPRNFASLSSLPGAALGYHCSGRSSNLRTMRVRAMRLRGTFVVELNRENG